MSISRHYRPGFFQALSGQHHVTTALSAQLSRGRVGHAYLFSGPRGVGKTTVARLLAKAVNCKAMPAADVCGVCAACTSIQEGRAVDVIEIDAASHTSVEHVREHIVETVRIAPTTLARKVFIIDEVHMLSKSAFNALLKTLEEPPSFVMFILATTELYKVPDTIVSRCQRFDFTTISNDLIVERLARLARDENRKVDVEILNDIASRSEGSLRDAESMLSQILALGDEHVTADIASIVLPSADLERVLSILRPWSAQDVSSTLRALHDAIDVGMDVVSFLERAGTVLRDVLLARSGGPRWLSRHGAAETQIVDIFGTVSDAMVRRMLNHLSQAYADRHRYHVDTLSTELAILDTTDNGAQLPAKVATKAETPAEPSPPVSGTLTRERVDKYWPVFVKTLREKHASLPLALEQATIEDITDGTICVDVPFAFYAETINDTRNNAFLADILSKTLGCAAGLRARCTEARQEDPMIQDILHAFGGDVANYEPSATS